jgi:hypothetical protein
MATINLTSTNPSGFLYTDFTQIKSMLDGLDDSADIVLTTRTINGKALSSNVTLTASDVSALASIVQDTSPALGGELNAGANSIGFTMQTATGTGATTINWKLGNKFKFTFGAQNNTFTFTAPTKPCSLTLMLIQDSVGSRLATWPASVKWPGGTAPTLTTTANAVDIISILYDGTNYFGSAALNFS